jgi:hypothetical protein
MHPGTIFASSARRKLFRSKSIVKKSYDEQKVLTAYVWRYYRRLFTDFERKVAHNILVEAKTQHDPAEDADYLRAQLGWEDDPHVAAALKKGVSAFQLRVCERILAEHAAQVHINRCPACRRVARTPSAKQCRWCRHDWHVTD